MKKILVCLLLFVIALPFVTSFSIYATNTTQSSLVKKVIITRKVLEKDKGLNMYIKRSDDLINHIKENKKELENRMDRLKGLRERINNSKISKSDKDKLLKIINYLDAKVNISLYNINPDYVVESTDNNTLAGSDEDLVEREILKLQSMLIMSPIKDIQKSMGYETKWDFSTSLKLGDFLWFGTIDAKIDFSDYILKISKDAFNWKWNLLASVNAKIQGEDVKVELSSFMDYVLKDSKLYLLLKDFDITNIGVNEIEYFADSINKIAEQEKYIVIENWKELWTFEFSKNISPSILEEYLSEPLFKLDKKEWNKYYLVPTKQGCNVSKSILSIFNWFGSRDCSDRDYTEMLRELEEIRDIYMEIWNETKITFVLKDSAVLEKLWWYFTFTDEEIKKVFLEITPPQYSNTYEWLELSYVKNEKLDFDLYVQRWDVDFKLKSELDENNKFKYISYSWKIKDELDSSLKLENSNLDLLVKQWIEQLKSSINLKDWNISGNTSYERKWKKIFNVKHNGSFEKDYLKLKNEIELDTILFYNEAEARDSLRMLDISMLRSAIEQTYQDTAEYPTKESFFNNNYSDKAWVLTFIEKMPKDPLGAVEIDGCKFGYKYKVWKNKVWIENSAYELSTCLETDKYWENWIYKKWTTDFKWIMQLSETTGEFYINWYTSWEKQEKDESAEKVNWNFDIEIDRRGDKNLFDLLLSVISDGKNIIEFKLKNNSVVKYKNVEIQEPKDTISLEDVFEE